jgi:hypothetical protein
MELEATNATLWPKPDTPLSEQLGRANDCIDYAVARWRRKRLATLKRIKSIRDSYNGIVNQGFQQMMDSQYGVELKIKYVDYRISKNKIDTLTGEFIQRPLNYTIQAVNEDALNERISRHNFVTGYWHAKRRGEIDRLDKMGLNTFEGVNVPEDAKSPEDLPTHNAALDAEVYMQKMIRHQFDQKYLMTKLYSSFQDLAFISESHFYTDLDVFGDTINERVLPENALFEEVEGDDFVEKSPYKGRRILMTEQQVIQTFDLNAEERAEIRNLFYRGIEILDAGLIKHGVNQELVMEVFHIEWTFLEPHYIKRSFDEDGTLHEINFSSKYYEKNEKKILRDVKNNKYELEIKFKERLWENYRIGKNIYKKAGPKKNCMGSVDEPYHAKSSYTNLLFNTHNGLRVSVYETMEEIKLQYNLARWQLNRELSKAKGTVFTYDRAMLPRGRKGKPVSVNEVISKMVNDGFIDYNSAGEGNLSGKNIDPKDAIKMIDLTPSSNLVTLIQICVNLENLLEKISPVNDNRQGQTAASETATNAQSDLMTSRTITEPMFFFYDKFVEQIIVKNCEYTKISWLLFPEKATKIIGQAGVEFIDKIADMSWTDWNCKVINSRKEEYIKKIMETFINTSLNKGEIATQSAMKAMMQTTMSEMHAAIEEGWQLNKSIIQQTESAKMQQIIEQEKQRIAREDFVREDEQAHEIQIAKIQAGIKVAQQAQIDANKKELIKQQAQLQ